MDIAGARGIGGPGGVYSDGNGVGGDAIPINKRGRSGTGDTRTASLGLVTRRYEHGVWIPMMVIRWRLYAEFFHQVFDFLFLLGCRGAVRPFPLETAILWRPHFNIFKVHYGLNLFCEFASIPMRQE